MPITLERPSFSPTRVTAGYSSLDCGRDYEITEAQLNQAYQRTLQQEYFRNETSALAPDGDIQDTTDWEQVVGIPLTGARIISRLKRLNANLWFERAHADSNKTGVYILKPDGMGSMEKQFICGMETEINPEITLRVTDAEGKAKGIIGGWRRLLMRLIQSRLITEGGAMSLFGPPSRGSENWARFTQ